MFAYCIEYVNEENPIETLNETGVVCGVDYGEATNRVVEFYGRENILSIKIYECEDVLTEDDVFDLFRY